MDFLLFLLRKRTAYLIPAAVSTGVSVHFAYKIVEVLMSGQPVLWYWLLFEAYAAAGAVWQSLALWRDWREIRTTGDPEGM